MTEAMTRVDLFLLDVLAFASGPLLLLGAAGWLVLTAAWMHERSNREGEDELAT